MKNVLSWFTHPPTDGPKSTVLLRLMAGGVFLWEGILKFVYTNQGVGRFTKLGIPWPHFTRCMPGERRRHFTDFRSANPIDLHPIHHRDDRGRPVDEDLALPRDFAAASTAGSAEDWDVGRAA